MPYTANGKTLLLDALRGGAPAANRGLASASLHSASPGDAGASELSGGGYARQAVTVSAANAEVPGSLDITNAPVFSVPAGASVISVGFWSGEGTPKFLAYSDLPEAEVYVGAGSYTLSDADLNLNS